MNLSIGSFAIALIVASVAGGKHTLRDRQAAQLLVCQLAMECVSTPSADGQAATHHHIECSPVEDERISDFSYPIDLPEDFVEANKVALMTGRLFATFPEGQIINGKVIRPLNVPIAVISPPESFESHHRKLFDTSGTKNVLVLRISANDASPAFSASQYYNYIFNNSQPNTAPSLSSQYSHLSFGQLNFVPTQYGVMEVPVNINANGAASSNIRDAAITYVLTQYGVSSLTQLADHVIFCFPPGTGNWAGSSPVMSWRIVMNNDWCGYISGLMHEMGHNLSLLLHGLDKLHVGRIRNPVLPPEVFQRCQQRPVRLVQRPNDHRRSSARRANDRIDNLCGLRKSQENRSGFDSFRY